MLRKLILKVSSMLVSYYSSQKFLGSFKDKHSFYSSYNSCDGHENSQYFNIQRKKLASDLKKFTFIKNVRHQLVCMFIKLYFKNDLVHILDVGGVSSSIYHNLRALHINSKVICMDLPETVKNVKDLEKNDLLFITSTQQVKKQEFDIIYFGSSIQYFLDTEMFDKILSNNLSKFLMIGGSITSSKNTSNVICAQPKMRGAQYQPYAIWSETMLIKILKKYNYQLEFKLPEHTHNVKFKAPVNADKEIKFFLFKQAA